MSNKETVSDLFLWAETLRSTGDSRDADMAMAKKQLQRHYTEILRSVLAVLMTAKEQPVILDMAIAEFEKALEQ